MTLTEYLQQRETQRCSLLAKWDNQAKYLSVQMGTMAYLLSNDPVRRRPFISDYTEADLASWARTAEEMSAQIERQVNELLGETHQWLQAAQASGLTKAHIDAHDASLTHARP